MISEESSRRMMYFVVNHLGKKQPRDDCLQLFELLLLSGGNPPRGAKFCIPGHVRQARWFSELLYAYKICFDNSLVSSLKRKKL